MTASTKQRIVATLVAAVVLTGLSVGSAWAAKGGNPGPNEGSFSPGSGADGHCMSPSGDDVNERYGTDARIIAPFCTEAEVGEFWTTSAIWIMAETFESIPEGFAPAGETPLEDFLAKLVGVKYIVDPGTSLERTYIYENTDDVGVTEIEGGPFDGLPAVNTLTMSALHPLRAGDHVVDTFWIFSDQHCDGLGDVEAENCFPAGETHYHRIGFEVVTAR